MARDCAAHRTKWNPLRWKNPKPSPSLLAAHGWLHPIPPCDSPSPLGPMPLNWPEASLSLCDICFAPGFYSRAFSSSPPSRCVRCSDRSGATALLSGLARFLFLSQPFSLLLPKTHSSCFHDLFLLPVPAFTSIQYSTILLALHPAFLVLLHVQGTKSEAARWTRPDRIRPDAQAITKPAFLLRAKAVDSLRLAVCTVLYLRLLLAFSPALSLVLLHPPSFESRFALESKPETPRADFPKAARTTQLTTRCDVSYPLPRLRPALCNRSLSERLPEGDREDPHIFCVC